ncbi:MAG: DNA/RNA non-specific endonuclease [Bacteroidales bacterium]|nr:DNA/RNA non-specific endonuclease [Bacteroidales bacterium]
MSISFNRCFGTALAAVMLLGAVACDKLPELLYGTSHNSGQEETEASIVPRKTTLSPGADKIFVEVIVSGEWTLTAEYPSDVEPWATIDPASGTDSNAAIRFRYTENTGSSRSVMLVLATSKGIVATVSITQLGPGETEESIGNYGYDKALMDWLELPETFAGDGSDVLIHDMEGGRYKSQETSGVRNWSCEWDYKEHLSYWVAYPLNNKLKGSGTSRSNDWGYDPLLPASIQPDITKTYGGGWTRGHQIPSADRLASYAANKSTFYPTNMTPQDYDFNKYIWASLEGAVRGYAGKSDTLYVVTGCVIDQVSRTSGANTGFAVKVPSYYYKALLYRGSASAAKATGGFMAAAFMLPHTSSISGGNYLDYIMTVDALEELLGYDLFPNLVKVVGEQTASRIESTLESWWK